MEHPALYNELKEIAPSLAELEKTNVFHLPENYFSGLKEEIWRKIAAAQLQMPPHPELPFAVPGGYFDGLAGNILQKIKKVEANDTVDELNGISPMLYSLQNKNVFSVPSAYFENFAGILAKILRPQAKVVIMKKRSIVWNCLAAALLTGIMAISSLWINNFSGERDFVAYNSKSAPLGLQGALQYKNEQQISAGIADLPDADIVKYLEATGSSVDDEALASGISEKELPDEGDYLTDENTLQVFLGKTGATKHQN